MTARQFLIDSFPQLHQGQLATVVDLALEFHAHELAEKIRANKCDGTSLDGRLCACGAAAADLIDPEPH